MLVRISFVGKIHFHLMAVVFLLILIKVVFQLNLLRLFFYWLSLLLFVI